VILRLAERPRVVVVVQQLPSGDWVGQALPGASETTRPHVRTIDAPLLPYRVSDSAYKG
jgi:hypothetical protein